MKKDSFDLLPLTFIVKSRRDKGIQHFLKVEISSTLFRIFHSYKIKHLGTFENKYIFNVLNNVDSKTQLTNQG